jgi:hypothetical protein
MMITSSIICASAAMIRHLRLQVLDAVLERGEHIHDASGARLRFLLLLVLVCWTAAVSQRQKRRRC